MADRLTMQDPRNQYPKPPFPEQPQPARGIVARMEPQPDHGETSYTGSGRLEGRKALITGGDSGIGRAAAIAVAREGADVAIEYLSSEEAGRRRGDRSHPVPKAEKLWVLRATSRTRAGAGPSSNRRSKA